MSSVSACLANSLKDSQYPVCTRCHTPWIWPRNIVYAHTPKDFPRDIPPTTTETIVTYLTTVPGTNAKPTIPLCVFSTLRFSSAMHCFNICDYRFGNLSNRLVTEFEYEKEEGEVFYDASMQESDDNGHAKLVTLNSWWNSLFTNLLKAAFLVMALQSDLMYIMSSFDKHPLIHSCSFLIAFLVTFSVSILVSMRQANKIWEIESSRRVGDLVTNCSILDLCFTYIALVSFIFFGFEADVTHVVIKLHPFKSVQPFAAFKSEGHRAFIIGYKSEHLFRVENQRGQFYTMPLLILTRLAMFSMKIFVVMYHNDRDWVLVAAIAAGVPTLCSSCLEFVYLYFDRKILKVKLLDVLNRPFEPGNDHLAREKVTCAKLLQLHFGIKHHVEDVGFLGRDSMDLNDCERPPCAKCGRLEIRRSCSSADVFEIGDSVTLTNDFREFGNATRGPLACGDVGEITQVGPDIPKLGRTLCVTRMGRSWWYSELALQRLESAGCRGSVKTGESGKRSIVKPSTRLPSTSKPFKSSCRSDHSITTATSSSLACVYSVDYGAQLTEPLSEITGNHSLTETQPLSEIIGGHSFNHGVLAAESMFDEIPDGLSIQQAQCLALSQVVVNSQFGILSRNKEGKEFSESDRLSP